MIGYIILAIIFVIFFAVTYTKKSDCPKPPLCPDCPKPPPPCAICPDCPKPTPCPTPIPCPDCPKPTPCPTPVNPSFGKTAVALYNFKADPNNPETMSITVGMELVDVEVLQYGWTKGTSTTTNKRGTFPSSYVKIID